MDVSSVKKIRRKMSLEEIASLCSGENNWETRDYPELGIKKVTLSDGPHGLRVETGQEEGKLGIGGSLPATCFPPVVLAACSFDEELIRMMAAAIAEEARNAGVDIILGPGLNIKRSPLCGRNFEYFSEDPLLSGTLAKAFVQGAAAKGIGTTLKHFVANNQETRRMTVDARIDQRALREIYLKAFEIAVKESAPEAVMCSYNSVNGEFLSQSKYFLTEILRKEWGFNGIVMSDWGAVYDRVKGLKAGLDLEMPGSAGVNDAKLVAAVREGRLKKTTLNTVAERMIRFSERARERSARAERDTKPHLVAHHQLARQIAAESMVLLKNEDGILPIDTAKTKTIALIGKMAVDIRYQGSGSSHINPTHVTNPVDAIKEAAGKEVKVTLVQGYSDSSASKDESMQKEAEEIASKADLAIVFAGLPDAWESEGYDRQQLQLPENQQALIQRVCSAQEDTVVVLAGGGVIDLNFADYPKAILESFLGGQAVGLALADILFGKINPSGHLAETIPMRLEDTPAYINFPGTGNQVYYGESIFVGYRYYDYTNREVRYPFGYGLSYTSFEYSQIEIEALEKNTFKVRCQVKNTGSRCGKTVVQLYTGMAESEILRPKRELRAFKKINLQPGEVKIVTFNLSESDFSFYSTDCGRFQIESGRGYIGIGESSRDIHLEGYVTLTETCVPQLTKFAYLSDFLANPRGREVVKMVVDQYETMSGQVIDEEDRFFITMLQTTPIIKIVAYTGGLITESSVERILDYVNGDDTGEIFKIESLFGMEENKKGWLKSLIETIFGVGEEETVYSMNSKVADLLDNAETYAILSQYCPEEYLSGEKVAMVRSMGLTLKKVQKFVPDDLFPDTLLEEVDCALRQINL